MTFYEILNYIFCCQCCCDEDDYEYTQRRDDKRKRKKKLNLRTDTTEHNFELRGIDAQTRPLSLYSRASVTNHFESPEGVNTDKDFDHRKRLTQRGYTLGIEIGKGGFGKVYKVVRNSDNILFACKTLTTKLMADENVDTNIFANEVWVLDRKPHINVIQLIQHFMYDNKYCYIILEFAEKTLEKHLNDNKVHFNEMQTKKYFIQICRGINHLHIHGIAHQDIKLTNILLVRSTRDLVVKVSDFGTSKRAYGDDRGLVLMKNVRGTLEYFSPQICELYMKVKNKNRNPNPFESDVWALGVCLYELLTKSLPFGKRPQITDKEKKKIYLKFTTDMYSKQMANRWVIPKNIFDLLTYECIDLLKGLLETDSFKRLTLLDILIHRWFEGFSQDIPNEDIKTDSSSAKKSIGLSPK